LESDFSCGFDALDESVNRFDDWFVGNLVLSDVVASDFGGDAQLVLFFFFAFGCLCIFVFGSSPDT